MGSEVRSILSYGEKILAWCQREAKRKGIPWVLSHAFVPAFVGGCLLGPLLLDLRPLLAHGESIGAVPLLSRFTAAGEVEQIEGIAVLLENDQYEFGLTWRKGDVDLMTSVDSDILTLNAKKAGRSATGFWLDMPPTGHSNLVAVIATGAFPEAVLLGNRQVDMDGLNIVSRESAGVAMTSFGAALFGFGLVISSVRPSSE